MKKIFTSILFSAITLTVFAQQAAQYSMYMWNKYAFNPAYAGMENSLSITGVYRNQWVNLPGSPVTQAVNAHMPLYIANGGVGISLENESLGSWSQTVTNISYDYQMVVNNSGVLSLGLSAGFLQRKFDGTLARTPEGIFDPDNGIYLGHNEQILPFALETGSAPTFNMGVFYQGEKLEMGISAANLLKNEIRLSTISFIPERTYYFYTGYKVDVGRKLQLAPSVLIKSDVYQTQLDISLLARYNENIFAGATFRGYDSNSKDALSIIGGFKMNEKITVGYTYDLTLSGLSNANSGTHELLINYNLGKQIGQGKPPIIIYNPRSL
jgi:type IX secretion system PorP/SprF family membrane protein